MYKNIYKDDAMKREEHMAVRTTAGWYLFTHQLLEVTGDDATAFLDRMFPGDIAGLAAGRNRYTTMLNEEGQIIDDVVVMHVDEGTFWVSTLYIKRMIPWFDAHKTEDEKVEYKDITAAWCMIALQGPKAAEVLASLVEQPIDELKFFQVADNAIGGVPVKINRAGFSGEKLGFEIYAAKEEQAKLVEVLRAAEEPFGMKQVTEIQVMIWTLPAEKGFGLMCDFHWANPFEVGLSGNINWDKDFIGKEALSKIKEEGPKRQLLGFTVDDVDIDIYAKNFGGPGDPVLFGDEEVGRVTKITYSYCLDKNIGCALVDNAKVKEGDKVLIHGHEALLCDKVFC